MIIEINVQIDEKRCETRTSEYNQEYIAAKWLKINTGKMR